MAELLNGSMAQLWDLYNIVILSVQLVYNILIRHFLNFSL